MVVVGTWLRVRNINERPMHGDEANQAYQFQVLHEKGSYKYEPLDFHGPTLYFMTVPLFNILGVESFKESSKWHFRALPLCFAIFTAFVGLFFLDLLTRKGVLLLTAFQMLSPSMIYYSTYYIQETLLVSTVAAFMATLWRYKKSGKLVYLILAGASLGFMHATKETFIISLFALVLSAAICFRNQLSGFIKEVNVKKISLFLFPALIVSVMFYSSFFTHPKGPVDSVTSLVSHVGRGLGIVEFPDHMTSGKGHAKESTYYLQNMLGHFPRKLSSTFKDIYKNNSARPISEVLMVVGVFLTFFFRKKFIGRLGRGHLFFGVNSITLLLVYSFIPYKTPWCAQVISYAFMLSASISFVRVFNLKKKSIKVSSYLVVAVLFIDMFRQGTLITDKKFCVSDRNQFAYSHAVYDVERLGERVAEFSEITGQDSEMPIHFLTGEYWPMPWYLRTFKNIGYWEDQRPTTDLSKLPIIITTPDKETLCNELSKSHESELRSRLPGYWLQVFYRKGLWKEYLESRELKKGK